MSRNDLLATGTIELCTECPLLAHQRHTGVVVGVWFALQNGSLKTLPRIIHGREQECLPSAALSLYPEGPKVPFRISSLGPCEPAILPQEAPILELLRWSAALSDPLRVVQVGAVVIALDFLPLGTWARALIFLLPWRVQRAPTSVAVSTTSKSWVIVAVLAIIADAEQCFSTESAMARSTFSAVRRRPFTTKCM